MTKAQQQERIAYVMQQVALKKQGILQYNLKTIYRWVCLNVPILL